MKVLLSTIFSLLLMASAFAMPFDEIKVGPNSKTSSLEIRYTSTHKRNNDAVISIINEKGNVESSFKVTINKGGNIIPLANALGLKEGLYTVNIVIKKKTLSTKLMIFE